MPAFLTSTCFRGAIVRAPFLGPKIDCRPPDDLAVAVESFLDFIVPCAILRCGCELWKSEGWFLAGWKNVKCGLSPALTLMRSGTGFTGMGGAGCFISTFEWKES